MLPRLVGRSRALEMVIGSDEMDAETAAHYGCKFNVIPLRIFIFYNDWGLVIVISRQFLIKFDE